MARNPLVALALFFLKLYRIFLSPFLGQNCRFYPTCSRYSMEAFEKHGFLKGFALTIFRVGRCHPWCNGPWTDPVPDRFAWRDLFRYNGAGTPEAKPNDKTLERD